jgi:hypothetical protein
MENYNSFLLEKAEFSCLELATPEVEPPVLWGREGEASLINLLR